MINKECLLQRLKEVEMALKTRFKDGDAQAAKNFMSVKMLMNKTINTLDRLKLKSIDSIVLEDINWDADRSLNLPYMVEINMCISNIHLLRDIDMDIDNLSKYLNDEYGYNAKTFNFRFV